MCQKLYSAVHTVLAILELTVCWGRGTDEQAGSDDTGDQRGMRRVGGLLEHVFGAYYPVWWVGEESRRECCLSGDLRMSGGRPGERRQTESGGWGAGRGGAPQAEGTQGGGFAESLRGVEPVETCGGAGCTGGRGLSPRPLPIWPSRGTFKEFGFYPE